LPLSITCCDTGCAGKTGTAFNRSGERYPARGSPPKRLPTHHRHRVIRFNALAERDIVGEDGQLEEFVRLHTDDKQVPILAELFPELLVGLVFGVVGRNGAVKIVA